MINLDFMYLNRTAWTSKWKGPVRRKRSDWGTGKMISEPTSQHKELQLPEGKHPFRVVIWKERGESWRVTP